MAQCVDNVNPTNSTVHVTTSIRFCCITPLLHRVSKKIKQKRFHHNLVKFPQAVIIFKKMAKTINLCNVHSFSTSTNLCQRTTVLNAETRCRLYMIGKTLYLNADTQSLDNTIITSPYTPQRSSRTLLSPYSQPSGPQKRLSP